ncbi:T9SS type A sorting domain-containing protein [Flavobacterium sp.]|uniref:T9SS type A sorting domain-containing protein n=1 Tax=Flavobacterium sp. TaxID=239 RepID=UPI0038FC1A31
MKKITILTLCLTLFLTGGLYSKTVWVSFAGAGAKNGTSEADAYDKAAFSIALTEITTAGDILRVVGAFAPGSQTLAKTFEYTIEGDAGGSTFIGVTGVGRMFTINGASVGQNVTFKNIIFSGQNSSIAGGGAVLFSNQTGVTINFENCRFVGNSLTSAVTTGGGALNITNSTVTITDCLFKENQALRSGGAIYVGTGVNATITRSTFYKNSTTDTNGAYGGAALYVVSTGVVTVYHCTFFQNNIGHSNQDYGTIRTEAPTNSVNVCTTVTNSLFYGNKVKNTTDGTLGGPSDWGSAPHGIQTFSYSLGQWVTSNIDFVTNSKTFVKGGLDPLAAANLASSNLTFDEALGKVTYTAPTVAGENSPIGFVAAGVDAGAWQSGLTLSVKDNEFAADFSVSYNSQTKNLKVLRSNDDSVSLAIYNLMGAKVLSRKNASKEENISASALQSGVYILVAKGSGNKTFAKKLVIN